MRKKRQTPLYQRLREILESAGSGVAPSVNTAQVVVNWLIGRGLARMDRKVSGGLGMVRGCWRTSGFSGRLEVACVFAQAGKIVICHVCEARLENKKTTERLR